MELDDTVHTVVRCLRLESIWQSLEEVILLLLRCKKELGQVLIPDDEGWGYSFQRKKKTNTTQKQQNPRTYKKERNIYGIHSESNDRKKHADKLDKNEERYLIWTLRYLIKSTDKKGKQISFTVSEAEDRLMLRCSNQESITTRKQEFRETGRDGEKCIKT